MEWDLVYTFAGFSELNLGWAGSLWTRTVLKGGISVLLANFN